MSSLFLYSYVTDGTKAGARISFDFHFRNYISCSRSCFLPRFPSFVHPVLLAIPAVATCADDALAQKSGWLSAQAVGRRPPSALWVRAAAERRCSRGLLPDRRRATLLR